MNEGNLSLMYAHVHTVKSKTIQKLRKSNSADIGMLNNSFAAR